MEGLYIKKVRGFFYVYEGQLCLDQFGKSSGVDQAYDTREKANAAGLKFLEKGESYPVEEIKAKKKKS